MCIVPKSRAIVPITLGKDSIVQAQSGTGKTATFSVGILHRINVDLKATQALILAPTRELASQISKVVMAIGQVLGVTCMSCVGGVRVSEDQRLIEEIRPQIIVATPGRILDLILKRRVLDTSHISIFALDEADEMLSRGFKDQIHDIFQQLNEDVQVILVSATMPTEVLEITKKFMRDPVKILVKKEELTLEGIRQFFINVEKDEWKLDTLCDLYDTISITQCVIFCNSRRRVDRLCNDLTSKGNVVAAIHGDMPQNERDEIFNTFKSGDARILVSTDLLARGIDIQQVSLVINFDLPKSVENYLHRIGRGGRFGRRGTAINFVTNDDIKELSVIEKHYNTKIEEMPSNIADILA
ncbi:Eukaryotic initiation factor 4A-I [Coelomomyces lativittatus]|nr:Eukaryotic initiation factor 4A-I [Coelomomyces lativittatus]